MKRYLLIVFCALSFIFSSCLTEDSFDSTGVINIKEMLVKSPDVIVYSGGTVLGNTFTTRATTITPEFERWQGDRSWKKPHDIIETERDYVIEYLQNNPNGGYKTLDIYEYIIQVVGNGGHIYNGDTADHNGAIHQVNASNEMNYCEIDGFFTQFNNTRMNSEDCILIKNVQATNATYHDSYGSTWEDHYAFYFITFPDDSKYGYMAGQTGLYLCYDFETYKESERWGVTSDGIYDDWVIKLSPSDGGSFEEPTPNNPDQDDPVITDSIVSKKNEVEVNLHGTNKNGEYLESHLSIHVRYATNVEIFIPVSKEYYCGVDDMAIVMKHEINYMIHGGPLRTEYKLKGSDLIVVLNIEYLEQGIRIWTKGITQEVIDWCAKECQGDGITFEVWNYFDKCVVNLETLKNLLNQATIKFLDDEPDVYVNSFHYTYDYEGNKRETINEDDCTVAIVNKQVNDYKDSETGYWKNNSPYNEIYYKK